MLLLEESWKFCQYQISLSSTGPGAGCSFHIGVGIHSLCAQPIAGGLHLFIVLADLFLITRDLRSLSRNRGSHPLQQQESL